MNSQIKTENLLIISENGNLEFNLEGDINTINEFYQDFFSIISIKIEDQTVILESPFIKVTDTIKNNIFKLIEKWKDSSLKVFQLQKLFKSIPEGHYISILPKQYIDSSNCLHFYLVSSIYKLNSGSKLEDVLNDNSAVTNYYEYFYDLFNIYKQECNLSYIGIKDKNKRVCRFCGNSQPKVTFNKIAHAIPEALGNKTIINDEECDICNLKFGNSLDNDLIDYLSFHRSLFRITGKKGNVKTKFKNGSIYFDNNEIKVESQDIILDEKGIPKTTILKSNREFILQNIYKALARISLGTISNFDEKIFDKTINWINGSNNFYEALPNIAFNVNQIIIDKPYVINYIRFKDVDLPFLVSELHLQFLVIVYIVPIKANDLSFVDSNKYTKFWETFKSYSKIGNWRFMDFSSQKSQKVQFTMNMIKNLN